MTGVPMTTMKIEKQGVLVDFYQQGVRMNCNVSFESKEAAENKLAEISDEKSGTFGIILN